MLEAYRSLGGAGRGPLQRDRGGSARGQLCWSTGHLSQRERRGRAAGSDHELLGFLGQRASIFLSGEPRSATGDGDVAVVVQRMIDPAVAGVVFTANPITGTRTEMVIDAVRGLGDKVVGGSVIPDHYRLTAEGLVAPREGLLDC